MLGRHAESLFWMSRQIERAENMARLAEAGFRISLTPDTFMRVITETCASTAKHGAKYLLVLNWHEGNIPSLAIAAEGLHREHGMTVLTVQACYVAEELYGHSCKSSNKRLRIILAKR